MRMDIEEEFKLIDRFLAEGKGYISKEDPVQASEKLYKVVEECIKLLAKRYRIQEYEEAMEDGRWWSKLLSRSARRLGQMTGERRIEEVWAEAFDLHVWGFHEKSLDIEHIKPDVPYVEWLVSYTKGTLNVGNNIPTTGSSISSLPK
ncbi:MAG: PaREP1 family protein [Candidatus Methanospirareceae archaeon]